MAPRGNKRSLAAEEHPLANYFWIAGLDGYELLEVYRTQTALLAASDVHDASADRRRSVALHKEPLNEEDEDTISAPESPTISRMDRQRDSWHRLSRLSDEARKSIQSLDGITKFHSNRSSATIKAAPASTDLRFSSALSDADFNRALQKFTSDRDTFFLDLNFKDSTPSTPPQPKYKSRAQKIVAEESDTTPNRSLGSVRRHISFREMNSVRRQTSVARRGSTRTSRRMSSYNAVIPQPEHIQPSPNEYPLKRTFEPVLLDRYPRPEMTEEVNRRDPFPDYVPMFAFPTDIKIVSSDSRPPTTWHEFSMTAGDNSKTPAVCVIVWIPMARETADVLERLCEKWRKANMTEAERELAASLAERLAIERAKLSALLARLPEAASGSVERDELEDDIGAVEEKINLMSDMLRPLRHGAANKIEGLTDGDSGLWIPRAYGLIGKDESMSPVLKEWLKAIVVPMMDGAILRVPPTSPRVGMWQPLERYVFNICCEAQRPPSSRAQIEIAVRELRLYAKKEASNELPGSRSTDLYALFRSLTIPNIVILFEYLLAEARIILVSAHVAMLKLVSKALLQLLWPLEWAGVYIPVLPARLMQVLEAPCPYICGIVRTGDNLDLPADDYVLVDLDRDELHGTEHPPTMPKQQRRKLMSLLYLAAVHHHSRGVPVGPPAYAMQAFPHSMFTSEHSSLFTPAVSPNNLVKLASLSSTTFGSQAAHGQPRKIPILNAFSQARPGSKSMDRPTTSSTTRQPSHADSGPPSPLASNFPPTPQTFVSRNDSGYALQTSLREKRIGLADSWSKNSDNFSSIRRKASLPFVRHGPTPSSASISPMSGAMSTYAPSSYAQSTLAASTVMPGMTFQPARSTENTMWVEGHCMQRQPADISTTCLVCDDKVESAYHRCTSCGLTTHAQCTEQIPIVCQSAFYPDQIRAAFARFFTSLFYSYRKFATPVDIVQKKLGMACKINLDAWFRSLPQDHGAYLEVLRQTQAFNEFIAEREQTSAASSESVMLFDALIAAKRGRSGRMRSTMGGLSKNLFGSKSYSGASLDFLTDTSTHVWRVVPIPMSADRPDLSIGGQGREYGAIIRRTPAKLEDGLFNKKEKSKVIDKEPALPINGKDKAAFLRKMNGLSMNAP